MITSVTHLTLSIRAAHAASAKFGKSLGHVALAKANDGTSIIVEARYPNRFQGRVRYGYLRFGARKPIWIGERNLDGVADYYFVAGTQTSTDEHVCREIVNKVTDAANKTEKTRKAVAA